MFYIKVLCFVLLPFLVNAMLEVNIRQIGENKIPPSSDAACMARYVVHNSNWGSLAYISQNNKSTQGTPLSRVFSISDGLVTNSTGLIYLMVSPMDLTVQDLFTKNNCSIIVSLAESQYCTLKRFDAQDPRCAQIILNGNFVSIQKKTTEYEFAKEVLWARHPVMRFWFYAVPGHKWFFAKIDIHHIEVVDAFGGRKFPSVADYFKKTCDPYLTDNISDINVRGNINV